MTQRLQIPAIQGIKDNSVEKILVPTKEILEQITGRSPSRQRIVSLNGNSQISGIINKVNEVIQRLQGEDVKDKSIGVNYGNGSSSLVTPSKDPYLAMVFTGDVNGTGTGIINTTIAANVVTNSKLAQVPPLTLKGNNTTNTANAADLTISQVTTMAATAWGAITGGIPWFPSTASVGSSGLLTANGFLIGGGTGLAPFAMSAMTEGQIAIGVTGGVPVIRSVAGDATLSTSGTLTISSGVVTNSKLALMTASTIKLNNAGTASVAIDGTPAQLAAMLAAPQVTVYTTGTGSYSWIANAKYIVAELIGGGGGGGGSGTSGGTGGNGGATTFGILTAGGGSGGANLGAATSGGISSNGDVNISGGIGQGADALLNSYGANGGVSAFGGAGPGGAPGLAGNAASQNSGSGGGSGGSGGAVAATASGGASGGYCKKLITSSATYAYSVGIAGTAGTAGANGSAGGAGANGIIIVTAFFQ